MVQELQAIYDTGFLGTILFVDDNLIANRRALDLILPKVIEWQKANNYPYPLTSEASINLARSDRTLQMLRDARFTHLFVGVETLDHEALVNISKPQNVRDPLMQSLWKIESYGIEIILAMIFGFPTDTERTGERVREFIADMGSPIVYFNLLSALPKTPLWARMEKEGRLLVDESGDARRSENLLSALTTNIRLSLPDHVERRMLRETVAAVFSPEEVYRRFLWNAEHVYGKQIRGIPPSRTLAERCFLVKFTLGTLLNVLVRIGLRAPYRWVFWRYLRDLIRMRLQGRISSVLEILLRTAPNAYHLIEWARVLVDQSTALEMEQQGEGRPLARKAPAEKEPLAIRATGSFTAAKMRHLESIS